MKKCVKVWKPTAVGQLILRFFLSIIVLVILVIYWNCGNNDLQLYVNGELIGGLDIMKEMDASGDLAETFKSASKKPVAAEPLEQR